ncbi:hypothetical protein ACLX1H_008639 [Fusarium chlamydosporum]
MSQQADIGEQVTAIVNELTHLRQLCASQNTKIENLSIKNKLFVKDIEILRGERDCYEKILPEKNQEIVNLNIRIDTWKADCESNKEKLTKLRKEEEDLRAKIDADNKRINALEADLSHRDAQVTKLIAILRRKITTNRVVQTALKAAYKILPSLEQQATYSRILEISKKAPHEAGARKELSDTLKEAV